METHDTKQTKSKESCEANPSSDNQDNNKSSNMEHQSGLFYKAGRIIQIARDMKNKIEVLRLSETRWLQTGQLRLSSGDQLLYSGHTEDGATHTEGVALMLTLEAQQALIGWETVNSSIIKAKFIIKKKDIKLKIIQCYAPTNDVEQEKNSNSRQWLTREKPRT
jgi:ribosomal protein L21